MVAQHPLQRGYLLVVEKNVSVRESPDRLVTWLDDVRHIPGQLEGDADAAFGVAALAETTEELPIVTLAPPVEGGSVTRMLQKAKLWLEVTKAATATSEDGTTGDSSVAEAADSPPIEANAQPQPLDIHELIDSTAIEGLSLEDLRDLKRTLQTTLFSTDRYSDTFNIVKANLHTINQGILQQASGLYGHKPETEELAADQIEPPNTGTDAEATLTPPQFDGLSNLNSLLGGIATGSAPTATEGQYTPDMAAHVPQGGGGFVPALGQSGVVMPKRAQDPGFALVERNANAYTPTPETDAAIKAGAEVLAQIPVDDRPPSGELLERVLAGLHRNL